MNEEQFSQPEIVIAILRELNRQNRKSAFPISFYGTLFQIADRIVDEANSAIAAKVSEE